VQVALADDSALFRDGLGLLLTDLGLDVLAAVATGPELLAAIQVRAPEVVILDIRMPPTFTDEGLQTAATLRQQHPQVGILLLSTYAESSYAARLLAIAKTRVGYLLKDRVDHAGTLRDGLRRIAAGGTVVDPEVVSGLLTHDRHRKQLDRLSLKETRVLALMAEGRSNAGIARELYMSAKTVETHVSSLFIKLELPVEGDVNRRVRAVLTLLRSQGREPG
jgi:DNA-binding NarL/FixJ family response regulator